MGSTFQITNNFFSRQLACNPEGQLLLKLRVDVVLVSSWVIGLGLASSSEEEEDPRIGPSTSPKMAFQLIPLSCPPPFSAIDVHFFEKPSTHTA